MLSNLINSLLIIISVVIIFFIIYMGIPSLWYRLFSKYTIKKTNNGAIAITFDDGPESKYTPQLLMSLSDANIEANFFVLGSSAQNNPDIIKEEIKNNHNVSLHGMNHKCHWFLTPSQTYKDVRVSMQIVNNLGGSPTLFRPPWGLYNIFTVPACKKHGLRTIHWSLHAYDWSASTTTNDIIKRISSKAKSEDIILLHDGRGKNNAPQRTVNAIPQIIKALGNKNIKIAKLQRGQND